MVKSSFLSPKDTIATAKIAEGEKIADFGAGSGFFTRAAAHATGKGGVVWAVDVHRDLLPRIKNVGLAEGLENIEVVHGDCEKHGGSHLPEGSFDLVIAANIFFCAEHKEGLVEEMYRVLRLGGRALVVDWEDSFGGLGPHPDHVVSKEKILKLFEAHHFAYMDAVPAGKYHWGFLVRKKAK
jgi:ubiquinone/menaquinone biosynthesis C-methylase UbiE